MSKASVVLVEGVPVPAKLAAAFRDRRDPSKTPFSYTAPLPPSIAVPLSKTPLCIPRVLPIVPQELIDAVREPEPPTMTHMQYNSPMPLYSRESAEEQYRQQIGNGSVPNIGSSDKHFDPEKSATLRAIQEQDREDEFGKNFFEKVAAAEAPKVPRDIEPSWASQARERSERARSRTPAAPPAHYQGGHDAIPMPPPSNQAPHSQHHSQAIPLGPPQSQQQYTNYQYDASPQQRSYAQSYKTGSPQKDKVVPEKGYQFGGMDFTGNAPVQDDGYGYYYTARPKTPVREERPGYKMGGMDFAENVRYSGYNPSYHGHGPDEPRLKSTFSADPHAPVNTYVAPNVEGVNPIRLVGDTISNQKIRHENYPSQDMKSNMGTSFAPPGGHRPDHRTVVPQPKPQEPLCYSLSAKKGAGGYYGGHVRAQSAAPGLEREKWTAEKEVFQTEPNWSRTVNERRQAWEHQAANTDARVSLPASAKVPAQQPPYWANKANSTHRIWQTAAERNLLQGQQQYGGDYGGEAQYGGQYGGGYSTQQDTYGYGSQQQQHQQQQQQYDYSQQGYQQQQQQQQQYQYQQQHQQNGYPSEQQRTTYSYSSQQAPVQSTPLQMDQSSFTKNKVTSLETTTTGPQSQAIALPAPTSGGQYQQYSSSEQRYDRRSQEQHEERVSRPVSHYEEQKDYQRSYRKETSEQRTVQPAPVSQSQVQSVTVNNDAFDRRTEMSETLPRGSLSNTQANAAGEYVDDHGRNVLYKRELTTSADPGREIQLLKEEERRVTEQPLEPGVISRHVTTKYYKKKTVTDTQQTVTQ
uniref:ZM domain-containing protein n=1 Tax=Steinernema glaseri TaxID=37863 RepID=A0A1I8AGI3_9BILA